ASLVTAAGALTEGTGTVAGVPLALPSILIETVSAGGGSVARVDEGGALKVGPESAGAVPGPACYGRGGDRPTVTDACLVLGWLDAGSPLADELRLDPALAERAVASLGSALGGGGGPDAIAAGTVAVAGAGLARAVDCRFAGQGYEVTIPAPADDPAPLAAAFLATHRARYGHEGGGQPIELVNLRVAAVKSGGGPLPHLDGRGREQRAPLGRRTATVGGARVEARVWRLGELGAGGRPEGPAL